MYYKNYFCYIFEIFFVADFSCILTSSYLKGTFLEGACDSMHVYHFIDGLSVTVLWTVGPFLSENHVPMREHNLTNINGWDSFKQGCGSG